MFGSLVGRTALPFTAILVLGAGPFQIAMISAAELVPALLLGPAIGVWGDRLHRRPILIAAGIRRGRPLGPLPLAPPLCPSAVEPLFGGALPRGLLCIR